MGAWLCLAAWLLPAAAPAETLYLTDRLEVPLRADFTEGAATVRTIESGAALEVLERYGEFARVRDAQGAEGWIEARYLTARRPVLQEMRSLKSELDQARAQIVQLKSELDRAKAASPAPGAQAKRLETDLAKAQAELAESRASLTKAQTELTESRADLAKTQTELAETRAELARTQGALATAQARTATSDSAPVAVETAPAGDESVPVVLWVVVSFAMLLVGFVAGIVWVRESIRRRMGGMYLRV